MEFTLRDFHPEDFETLWRIDQECFPPGISYTPRELTAYMRRHGSFTLLAESHASDAHSGIVGFLLAEMGRHGLGHIITIDVIPGARKLGIGSQMLAAAEARLRTAQCHSVLLETAVDNLPALAFYKRHHYDVMKTIPRYYSNGLDALALRKNLLPPMVSP